MRLVNKNQATYNGLQVSYRAQQTCAAAASTWLMRTVQVWVRERAVPLMHWMLGVRVLVVGRMDDAGRVVFAEDVRPCPIFTPPTM